MAKVIVPRGPLALGDLRPRGSHSRVISFMKQVAGGGPGVIAVSEIVGQEVCVLRVQVMTVWLSYTGIPLCIFDLYTGQAGNVNVASFAGWDLLLPVFVDDQSQQWVLTPEFTKHDWSLNRRYHGDSRRFGLSVIVVGVGSVYVFVSVEVAEG